MAKKKKKGKGKKKGYCQTALTALWVFMSEEKNQEPMATDAPMENQENEKLKSNLIVQLKYFKTRISSLKLYKLTLEELQYELSEILKVN